MAKILVVEDDVTILRGLEGLLTAAGHQATGVESGELALEAIESDLPELVVTDMLMPGMSGMELLDAVRARPEWGKVPFVVITAQDTADVEERISSEPESIHLLCKPFDAQQLYEVVTAALDHASG